MNRKYTIEVFNKHAVITSNFSIDGKDYLKFKQVEDMLNNPNDYRISKRMHLKVNDDAGFDAYFHEKPYEGHIMAKVATYDNHPFCAIPKITKVIFNDPATIVFWLDGTKTVVKCDDKEIYDPEKGLAMAISKKALGNQGNYYNEFKKWLPDKMHLAPNVIVEALCRRYPYGIMARDISLGDTEDHILEDPTSRNQDAVKALEKSLNESIRKGELKTSDLYNQTIVKKLLFGQKGDDQND